MEQPREGVVGRGQLQPVKRGGRPKGEYVGRVEVVGDHTLTRAAHRAGEVGKLYFGAERHGPTAHIDGALYAFALAERPQRLSEVQRHLRRRAPGNDAQRKYV